jgi:hypothetical protein
VLRRRRVRNRCFVRGPFYVGIANLSEFEVSNCINFKICLE